MAVNLHHANNQMMLMKKCWHDKCGEDSVSDFHGSCRFHFVQRFFARQFLYSRSKGAVDALLAQYDTQDGKCFYTHRPISIGTDAVIVWRWPERMSRDERIVLRPWSARVRHVVWAHKTAALLRQQFVDEADFEQMIMDLAETLQLKLHGG